MFMFCCELVLVQEQQKKTHDGGNHLILPPTSPPLPSWHLVSVQLQQKAVSPWVAALLFLPPPPVGGGCSLLLVGHKSGLIKSTRCVPRGAKLHTWVVVEVVVVQYLPW